MTDLLVRTIINIYIKQHAVRKSDVALARGEHKGGKRRKTGVPGSGRWKTWTPEMMLKTAFLVCKVALDSCCSLNGSCFGVIF